MKINPKKIIIITLCILFTLAAVAGIYIKNIIDKGASDDPKVWEDDIRDFEEKDRKTPPELNRILFIGSSSIRKWKTLQEDMLPLKVINRGFGGSKIPDIIYYMNRIVLPYKPKTIVFYAGENDMSRGKRHSPEQVLDNFKTFTKLIHAELPETKIFFISIKPSKFRWKYWKNMNRANDLIKEYTQLDNRLGFFDMRPLMLDIDGQLNDDLFFWDRIHMNSKGYELWKSLIKPALLSAR